MLSSRLPLTAVAVLISLSLSACSDSTAKEAGVQKLLTVETEQLSESNSYSVKREYVGAIHASQKANLGFELSGKIARIHVDVGEKVAKGEPLITLDTQLLVTEQKQLQAQLKEIEAQLSLTKTNLKRQHSLQEKGFSSEAEIDALTSQNEALAANALQVQSAISANQLKQQKSIIKAPYPGIISDRFVSLGDVVAASAPTLALFSTGDKEAVIGVYKGDVKAIEAQKTHTIRIDEQAFNAKLISLPSNIDSNSRNVRLRFSIEGALQMLDGELAYLSYYKQVAEKGYWVPNSALTDGLRGTWNLYVLAENEEQNVIESRSVQVLYSDNDRVYVQGALSGSEQVVVSGLHKVVPGQAVQIAN